MGEDFAERMSIRGDDPDCSSAKPFKKIKAGHLVAHVGGVEAAAVEHREVRRTRGVRRAMQLRRPRRHFPWLAQGPFCCCWLTRRFWRPRCCWRPL